MNGAILKRTRLGTLAAAALLTIPLGLWLSWRFAAGFAATGLWAIAGFWALEGLTRRALVPPGAPRPLGPVAVLALAKVVLYGLAVWVLFARVFPPVSHLLGFSLLLVVLVVSAVAARGRARSADPTVRGDGA